MGGSVIDRAFFELNFNSSEVEKGASGILRSMAGMNDAVKQAQQKFLDLNNTGKDLASQMDRLDQKHEVLVQRLRSGTLSTAELNAAKKEEKSLLGEIEKTEEKAIANKAKVEAAQKRLTDSTQQSGSAFSAFGKIVGDFATHPVQSAQRGMESLITAMGPTVMGIAGIATAAAAAGMALLELGRHAAESAQQITNMSLATGLTVEQVQALNRLGKERGLGDLAGQIERIQAQLGKGAGGPFTEALLKMGIAPKEGADALYYLKRMQEHYALITDEQKRNAQAHADLGIRMKTLIPLVVDSTGAIWAQYEAIKASGAVVGKEAVESLTELNKELGEYGRTWEAVKHTIGETAGAIELFIMKSVFPTAHGLPSKDEGVISPSAITGLPQERFAGAVMGTGAGDILQQRSFAIASADAIAAGGKRELINAQIRLNQLEKQYSEIKADSKGMEFDEKRLNILSEQIRLQKEAMKDYEAMAAAEKKANEESLKQFEKGPKLFEEALRAMVELWEKSSADVQEMFRKNVEAFDKGMEHLGGMKMRGFFENLPGDMSVSSGSTAAVINAIQHPSLSSKDAAVAKASPFAREVTTIWNDFVRGLANASSGLDLLRSAAQSLKRFFLELALQPLQNMVMKALGQGGTGGGGVGSTLTGWWGGIKNLFGGGGGGGAAASLAGEVRAPFVSALSAGAPIAGASVVSASGTAAAGSKLASGLTAAGVAGGTMLMTDAYRRGNVLEGMAGGAAAGAAVGFMIGSKIGSVGGPLGTAIGAGIGILAGGLIAAFGGGEVARTRAREQRSNVQSGYMFDPTASQTRTGAFGADSDVSVEYDMMGRARGRGRAAIGTVVINMLDGSQADAAADRIIERVNRKILTGGSTISDNIAWASGRA